ncbi:MAG: hypothetical protein Q8S03_01685 [Brevundimonas sp.]|uniref:hypothetical protein n=1 Tax=Brevundimonas sp. TaxID=1871086 RepID=UPI002734A877|nr:hypothetical protein [Brevundimonas sp.]MDP3403368.1 hypothetical protein [Brevundimonas sp.]
MSCGIALAAALLLSNPNVALSAAQPPAVAGAPVSVAGEPLFIDIVARSSALKAVVDSWNGTPSDFDGFKVRAAELAALDLQAHLILKERGTDGDLTCILRGIAEDIPVKVEAVERAVTPHDRATALGELSYLLNDNVEVITSPPQPAA